MKFSPKKKKETILGTMGNQGILIGSFSDGWIAINSESDIQAYINTNIVYTTTGYTITYIGTENNSQDHEV